ncbi:unnamed protein product, partial [Ixodes pacificus]
MSTGGHSSEVMASVATTTTISSIAVQSGNTRLVIALLQVSRALDVRCRTCYYGFDLAPFDGTFGRSKYAEDFSAVELLRSGWICGFCPTRETLKTRGPVFFVWVGIHGEEAVATGQVK